MTGCLCVCCVGISICCGRFPNYLGFAEKVLGWGQESVVSSQSSGGGTEERISLRLLAFFRQNDEMSVSSIRDHVLVDLFPIIFILNKFIYSRLWARRKETVVIDDDNRSGGGDRVEKL